MSEEALQIPVNRIEAKDRREKARYIHLNSEFQRIARRNKKAFLSNQCKEIRKITGKRKEKTITRVKTISLASGAGKTGQPL